MADTKRGATLTRMYMEFPTEWTIVSTEEEDQNRISTPTKPPSQSLSRRAPMPQPPSPTIPAPRSTPALRAVAGKTSFNTQ